MLLYYIELYQKIKNWIYDFSTDRLAVAANVSRICAVAENASWVLSDEYNLSSWIDNFRHRKTQRSSKCGVIRKAKRRYLSAKIKNFFIGKNFLVWLLRKVLKIDFSFKSKVFLKRFFIKFSLHSFLRNIFSQFYKRNVMDIFKNEICSYL